MDTIYALSTAAGRAAVAVIRISGPDAASAVRSLIVGELPPPRVAAVRELWDPRSGERLDRGLLLHFPAPNSFTGEDLLELQLHGGRAVVQAALDALGDCAGLRPAEPGEFTRRAFEHGKLDLTAAEGLADLVNAETAAQRRQALRQLGGELGKLYESWRQELLSALARIEACIDFPEEGLPGDLVEQTRVTLTSVARDIDRHLNDNRRGERLRDGIHVAILGAPNVGKSSLLNALAGRPAAIVSAKAGTTRDIIEVHMDLAGYPVVLADTAGLHDTEEEVEIEGVRRARERAGLADIKILMISSDGIQDIVPELRNLADGDAIFAVNKCDLFNPGSVGELCGRPTHLISALTGAGIEELLDTLTAAVIERAGLGMTPALTRERHRLALEACLVSLQRSLGAEVAELLAEDLRLAVRAIGRITGRVDVEDMLDCIFREFCIGK